MCKLASACVLMMRLSVESSAALECYDCSEGLSEEEFQGERNARLASCEPDLTSSETMYYGLENLVCLYIKFQRADSSIAVVRTCGTANSGCSGYLVCDLCNTDLCNDQQDDDDTNPGTGSTCINLNANFNIRLIN